MSFIDEIGDLVDVDFEKCEQELVREYIPKDSTVLELGARYGTVSCVISQVLSDPTRHVAVEPDDTVIQALETNKKVNGGHFNIFNGVVSSKNHEIRRIDNKHEHARYGTYTEEVTGSGLHNMSLNELQKKYDLVFDCLVADCEGFLLTFVDENPWFLDQVKVIIFEKDGTPWSRVDPMYDILENTLVQNKFKRVFSIPHPIYSNNVHFHNVWIK